MTGREISGRVTGAECDPLAAAAAQRESVFLFCLPPLHLRVPQLSFSTCLSLSVCWECSQRTHKIPHIIENDILVFQNSSGVQSLQEGPTRIETPNIWCVIVKCVS